jgi:hypothetical protein
LLGASPACAFAVDHADKRIEPESEIVRGVMTGGARKIDEQSYLRGSASDAMFIDRGTWADAVEAGCRDEIL